MFHKPIRNYDAWTFQLQQALRQQLAAARQLHLLAA